MFATVYAVTMLYIRSTDFYLEGLTMNQRRWCSLCFHSNTHFFFRPSPIPHTLRSNPISYLYFPTNLYPIVRRRNIQVIVRIPRVRPPVLYTDTHSAIGCVLACRKILSRDDTRVEHSVRCLGVIVTSSRVGPLTDMRTHYYI